jgi:hypothetical protein
VGDSQIDEGEEVMASASLVIAALRRASPIMKVAARPEAEQDGRTGTLFLAESPLASFESPVSSGSLRFSNTRP